MTQRIDSFDGEFDFLSNFLQTDVFLDGVRYANSEAAFQAQKCAKMIDRFQFANLLPGKAKRLGRKVTLRSDWEQVKDQVMYDVVKAKFQQHPQLRDKLVATGDSYLEEGNTWNDTYWGVCKGEGQNKLGHILMRIRSEFIGGILA
jgi:ribA/ribD-fused uncharacterized protein